MSIKFGVYQRFEITAPYNSLPQYRFPVRNHGNPITNLETRPSLTAAVLNIAYRSSPAPSSVVRQHRLPPGPSANRTNNATAKSYATLSPKAETYTEAAANSYYNIRKRQMSTVDKSRKFDRGVPRLFRRFDALAE